MYYDKRIENQPAPVQHPELEPVQQYCLEAAEYIRIHGWCQGSWAIGRSVCTAQALRMVIPKPGYIFSFRNALQHLIDTLGGEITPVMFNDAPGRTKEDVLALLEKAAFTPVKRR